jgi:hypothetical protein
MCVVRSRFSTILLPRFDVRQVHEAWVPAPVDVVYSAVKQVTGREVRF